MALTAGSVIARFKSDLNNFNKGVSNAQRQMGDFRGKMSQVGATMTKVGGITTAALTAPIVGLGIAAVKTAGRFEQYRAEFGALLGSAERGREVFEELITFAKATPFDIDGVIETGKRLLATGTEAENLTEELRMLGDISAALGVPVNRLAINFSQVRARGTLTRRELNDFSNAGLNLTETLADMNDVSKAVISEMITDGEVTFEMVQDAFQKMTEEGGSFHGMMAEINKTLPGQIEELKEEIITLAADFGEELLPIVKDVIAALRDLVSRFKGLDEGTRKTIIKFIGFLAIIGPVLMIVGGLITAITTIAGVISGPALLAIIAIIGGLWLLYEALKGVGFGFDDLKRIWKSVINFLAPLQKWFTNTVLVELRKIWDEIKYFIDKVIPPLVDIVTWLYKNFFVPMIEWFAGVWERNWDYIKAIIKGFADYFIGIIKFVVHLVSGIIIVFLNLITGRWDEAWEAVKHYTQKLKEDVIQIFNGILGYLKGIGGILVNVITAPFRDAWNKAKEYVEKIKNAIKDAFDFSKRHSPSVMDIINRSVDKANRALGELGNPIVPFSQQISGAKQNVVNISMAGANITNEAMAEEMAERMGDRIIRILETTRRV